MINQHNPIAWFEWLYETKRHVTAGSAPTIEEMIHQVQSGSDREALHGALGVSAEVARACQVFAGTDGAVVAIPSGFSDHCVELIDDTIVAGFIADADCAVVAAWGQS